MKKLPLSFLFLLLTVTIYCQDSTKNALNASIDANIRTQYISTLVLNQILHNIYNGNMDSTQVATMIAGAVTPSTGVAALASGSTTNTSTMVISLVSYYSLYSTLEVQFDSLATTSNNDSLTMQVSSDGTTFNNGSNNYTYGFTYLNYSGSGYGFGAQGDTIFALCNAFGNTSHYQGSGKIIIIRPSQSTYFPNYMWDFIYGNNAGFYSEGKGSGTRLTQQVTKAVRLRFSSGTITGRWKLYGYN